MVEDVLERQTTTASKDASAKGSRAALPRV
jgi:hypothetical protein